MSSPCVPAAAYPSPRCPLPARHSPRTALSPRGPLPARPSPRAALSPRGPLPALPSPARPSPRAAVSPRGPLPARPSHRAARGPLHNPIEADSELLGTRWIRGTLKYSDGRNPRHCGRAFIGGIPSESEVRSKSKKINEATRSNEIRKLFGKK